MDSKGLKMPVSESDKLEVSVLGSRFSEKAEHLPIKKRRVLFRPSSPPLNTASLEGTERVAACLDEVRPRPDASCPPAASSTVADVHQSGSSDSKVDGKQLVKASEKASEDEHVCGTSLVAVAACSKCLGGDADVCEGSGIVSSNAKSFESPSVKFKENSVRSINRSAEQNDAHISTAPDKDVASSIMDCSYPDKATLDNSTPDESTLDNSCSQVQSESACSRMNQVTSKMHKSAARDGRLHWDLNTVMDAWEEPLESVHDVYAADAACSNITYAEEEKNFCKEGNSEGCKLGRECGSASENIGNEILPVDSKSLIHLVKESKPEECKPGCADISKLLSPVIDSAPCVAVNKTMSLYNQHIDSSNDAIPVAVPSTLALEYPACDISAKHVNVNCKNTDDSPCPMAAGTDFSLEYSIPPGFDHIDSSNDAIPVAVPSTLALEYPACDISAKHVNVNCKNTDDLPCPMAAGTDFSLEYSIPPGFDHCINMRASEENVDVSSTIVGSGNNINHAIGTVQTITENEKHNLSLTTATSLENGVHQSGSTFNEDDEVEVKKAITSNGITMEDLVCKGIDLSQETDKGDSKAVNQTTFGSLLVTQSSVAEVEDQPAAVSSLHDAAHSDAEVTIKAGKSLLTATSEKPMMLLTGTVYHESQTVYSNDLVSYGKEACDVPLDDGFGYENFQSDVQAGSEVDNVDELSVGCDSQYEDGELRESSIQTWEGYAGEDRENEHGTNNRGASFDLGTFGARENSSQCLPKGSSRMRSTDVGSQRGPDEISSVLLPEKLDSSDQVSGSGQDETRNGTRQVSKKDVSRSDQWKMNVSGWDLLPENHSSSTNVTKIGDFSSIKFSSRIRRYGSETEDVETKVEGSRFYRREPLSRRGGPSARDAFLNRGRFRMQGCSSSGADDSISRSIRESGALRSLRQGKYSSHIPANGCRGGTWNRSPGRDRDLNHLHSPPYQGPSLRRSMLEDVASVDDLTNEVSVDPNDDGRPGASSYIIHQSFRSRLPVNSEEDDFRARLGLRPSGDTCHNRFVNVGRGRSLRYGSRHNGGGPRGRYYVPASDDYDEPSMEYSHPFPSRRRCFSPIERRGSHPCAHHRSGSGSPSRSRTRSPITDGFRRHSSKSPNLRCDARMRRPRSPNCRHGFEADHVSEYNLEPRNNNSPPSSRWVNYKQRSVFDRRSPPPGRIDPPLGERFSFYDSSRKIKQNENSRSGFPGRFSELHGAGRGGPRYLGSDGDLTDHEYRHGGFVRRYDMGRPLKHFRYDEEDGYGPVYDSREKDALEFHGRGNPKPYSHGTDSRFRDLPRRPREERENW